ncbi:MAG: cyclase family protein [Woeseiaceae bacterium]
MHRSGKSLARRLNFDGQQPSYYGVARAEATPMKAGSFVGDTRLGGSCNASTLTLNPHCHGTHTECIGHVVDRRLHALDVIPSALLKAKLVSLRSVAASRCTEQLAAATQPGDRVLTLAALHDALDETHPIEALIIRTRPNPLTKRTQQYTDSGDYPFFTRTAVDWMVEQDIQHLLIDTPSLDRLDDQGALELHRRFWRLPQSGGRLGRQSRRKATITEMIYVENKISDGDYLLALQPAPFSGDATPSNPTIFPPSTEL